jgi:hypothetical protein
MELSKELLSRYTQEYALDESTRIKAEELYQEYLSKQGSQSAVSKIYYFLPRRSQLFLIGKIRVDLKLADNRNPYLHIMLSRC